VNRAARIISLFELGTALWALGTAPYAQILLRADAWFSLVVVASVLVMHWVTKGRLVALALCVAELVIVAFAVSVSAYQQGVLLLDLLASVFLTVFVALAWAGASFRTARA
jgi:hypothetical protein